METTKKPNQHIQKLSQMLHGAGIFTYIYPKKMTQSCT